jgi:hypothetical protein
VPISGYRCKPVNLDELLATIRDLPGIEWTYAPAATAGAAEP